MIGAGTSAIVGATASSAAVADGRAALSGARSTPTAILRKKTTKTGQEAVHDTKAYPLVAQTLDLIAADKRIGPVVINETTGLPYRYRNFYQMWRAIATKAGVPVTVWNRDSRAGGVTEGSDAGVDLETLRHHANHSQASTTAIYSRKTLEKTRSVAAIRVAARNKPETPA